MMQLSRWVRSGWGKFNTLNIYCKTPTFLPLLGEVNTSLPFWWAHGPVSTKFHQNLSRLDETRQPYFDNTPQLASTVVGCV